MIVELDGAIIKQNINATGLLFNYIILVNQRIFKKYPKVLNTLNCSISSIILTQTSLINFLLSIKERNHH